MQRLFFNFEDARIHTPTHTHIWAVWWPQVCEWPVTGPLLWQWSKGARLALFDLSPSWLSPHWTPHADFKLKVPFWTDFKGKFYFNYHYFICKIFISLKTRLMCKQHKHFCKICLAALEEVQAKAALLWSAGRISCGSAENAGGPTCNTERDIP